MLPRRSLPEAKSASSKTGIYFCTDPKYALIRKDGLEAWAASARILSGLPVEFHPATRRLADAFAAALAKEKKAEPVTGDPEFKPLEKEIKLHWLK